MAPATLLGIPVELRLIIYNEIVLDDFDLPCCPIAQTCSQTRNESLPIFFADVTLMVEYYFTPDPFHEQMIDLFLGKGSTSKTYGSVTEQHIDGIPNHAWLKFIRRADILVFGSRHKSWAKLSVLFSSLSYELADWGAALVTMEETLFTVSDQMYCRAMKGSIEAELAIFAAHQADPELSGSLLKRILSHVQHFQRALHADSHLEHGASHA